MTTPPFRFEILNAGHNRTTFRCGEPALDSYFRKQVTQDSRRRVANCVVAIEASSGRLAAYYTLSAASIALGDLPDEDARRLPRYPTVPIVRIGRLAVDQGFQGRGLGGALIMNAADRTLRGDIAAFAILVDAKNDQAAAFYHQLGFRPLQSQPRALFLPLATVAKALQAGRTL